MNVHHHEGNVDVSEKQKNFLIFDISNVSLFIFENVNLRHFHLHNLMFEFLFFASQVFKMRVCERCFRETKGWFEKF